MTTFSFNALREPWIPVVRQDGVLEEVGIHDCLARAHGLREIRHPAPIVEFGMYRLLEAFVLDALIVAERRPDDIFDLKDLLKEEALCPEEIVRYEACCGDVFDLFHTERPFLQSVIAGDSWKPLAGLFPAVPSGTNALHWHHRHESALAVSPAEALRMLTTIAPFMTAGGAGLSPSINGAPALYVLPVGANLFETLVLNLPLRQDQEGGKGVVAWRNSNAPGEARSQATMVEALTWRPRRIQLLPETEEGQPVYVRKMKFEKGDSTTFQWVDPNLAYKYDDQGRTPIRLRENRPPWRDAGALVLLREDAQGKGERKQVFRRPDAMEQAFQIVQGSEPVVLQIYGMRTDMKMKIFEWVKGVWKIPSTLGRSTRLGALVEAELQKAEAGAQRLRRSIRALVPRELKPTSGEAKQKKPQGKKKKTPPKLKSVADRCEHAFWQCMEPLFHRLMCAFAALRPDAPDDPDLMAATAREWRSTIALLALEQFDLAAKDLDADSDALERQVRARILLLGALKKILGEVK